MRTNEIPCFYDNDEKFIGGVSLVNIAYIEHLNCLSIALDIVANEERHTVFFPHSSIPAVILGLSSAYFSVTDNLQQMEAEHGK